VLPAELGPPGRGLSGSWRDGTAGASAVVALSPAAGGAGDEISGPRGGWGRGPRSAPPSST
jgi:hypothetical protein